MAEISVKSSNFPLKEQREYEQIDEAIASLEEKIQQTEKDISANSSDYGALQELTEKKEQLETELAEKMERWVYLNDLAERLRHKETINILLSGYFS